MGRADPRPAELALGAAVPDFTLIDQTGHNIGLSHLAGKVLVSSFIYTSCPLPNYCFRLSNNLGRLQRRFADRMGRDLVMLSVSIDPVHDTPEVLARYAVTWKADAKSWHFLTGPEPEVKAVCRWFGVKLLAGRGVPDAFLTQGNEFTAEPLGDFVEAVLGRKE